MIARPSPVPSNGRLAAFFNLPEFRKNMFLVFRRDPDAGILDRQMHDMPFGRNRHRRRAPAHSRYR